MIVLILHLQLGPGMVDDCLEGEVSSISPATVDQEESTEDCKDDGSDDVEEEKPCVDGK